MLWLIDGYNVIRQDPELAGVERQSLRDGRDALLRLLAPLARGSADEFVVVFDGARVAGAAAAGGRVRVLFSRPPETADDLLVRKARETGPGATVVTSDRRIQDAARRLRAAVVSAEAFLDRLAAPGAGPIAAEETDEQRRGPKRGNPRRRSRAERRSRRALGRLSPPPE
jgi:predicted RNA-binding protein with PIN domain